ncbi:MAG TPA: MlaD family protein [Chthoniobacter sp.]|jgi:ABC-type transporter Mla subunit MlaD
MNVIRDEIRTGLLVLVSLVALVGILLYLGAPGVFVPQHTYWIYFQDASGIKPGSQVQLAGRKIGQVRALFSPVPDKERPEPKLETKIEVQVNSTARVFNRVKAQITQPTMLGDSVIDFSSGDEASGLAKNNAHFIGELAPSLSSLAPIVMERLDPVLAKLNGTLDSLQKTSDNFAKLTSPGADLPQAFSEFKQVGVNLNQLSSYQGPLQQSLQNIETLTGENGKFTQTLNQLAQLTSPDGSLSKTFKNTEKFTTELNENHDAATIMRNLREATDNLNRRMTQLGQEFSVVGVNLEQATDTVKRQPWRLIWKSTKQYGTPTPTPTPAKRFSRR